MAVIDFHSHFLPGIDDGSKDTDTSVEMLDISSGQGVEVIVATPHFYADRERIDRFLEKRRRAFENLQPYLKPQHPRIFFGAEVAFFDGISRAGNLEALKIGGTDLLLLEMPFAPWGRSAVQEVADLVEKRKFRIIIAHLERFLRISGNRPWVEALLELPVIIQINAGSLLEWRQRGNLVKMFRNGTAQLLGSDCHGVEHRPPNLLAGRQVLEKKLGRQILTEMDRFGTELLLRN